MFLVVPAFKQRASPCLQWAWYRSALVCHLWYCWKYKFLPMLLSEKDKLWGQCCNFFVTLHKEETFQPAAALQRGKSLFAAAVFLMHVVFTRSLSSDSTSAVCSAWGSEAEWLHIYLSQWDQLWCSVPLFKPFVFAWCSYSCTDCFLYSNSCIRNRPVLSVLVKPTFFFLAEDLEEACNCD